MTSAKISFIDVNHVNKFLLNLELAKNQECLLQKEDKETNKLSSGSKAVEFTSGLTCLTCKCSFDEREFQILHYRGDWHRYNLKQKLLGEPIINEEQFELTADTLSISGSESDTDEDYEDEMNELSISILKEDVVEGTKYRDDRQPKFYFKNGNDEIISIYKKVLFNNQVDVMHADITQAVIEVLNTAHTSFCFLILLNAGHFAAAVFEGATVVAHKTFHRYIVRAKRGTVQSINDSNRRGNAAKSAGASIRRHNEAALEESIKSLIESWKEIYFDNCSHVFVRIPQYRKTLFYGGKDPIFNPKDPRIRSIPFATRRPTHSEVKRVHQELFSITLHGDREAFESSLPSRVSSDEEKKSVRNQIITSPSHDINMEIKEEEEEIASHLVEDQNRKKQKKKQKKKTSGLIVDKPKLPEVTVDPSNNLTPHDEEILAQLYTACIISDTNSVTRILTSNLTPSDSSNSFSDDNSKALELLESKLKILRSPLDSSGDTLLHVASRRGDKDMIRVLLEQGSDPTVRNSSHLPPYCACANKESKNVYKEFRTCHPEMYDYKKAEMPPALSAEQEAENKKRQSEKRKAQRAARKEKEKLKKEEEMKKLEEKSEKDRFLSLSDREKRLIAVERRLKEHGHLQESQSKRCFTCAESLFAKVPFEYFDYQFCSINCLKIHKNKRTS